jgi:hypothetical protein
LRCLQDCVSVDMLHLVRLCRLSAALDELLPDAFATVREASRRVLGMRHFDSQLVGEFGSSSSSSSRSSNWVAATGWQRLRSVSTSSTGAPPCVYGRDDDANIASQKRHKLQ